MSAPGKINSININVEPLVEKEDVKILYELNVLFKSRSLKNDSQGDELLNYEFFMDWFNNPRMKYEDIDVTGGSFKIVRRNLKIHEISLLKNIERNVMHEYTRIKNFAKERNILLRINIPIQTDFSITAETFAFMLIDKIYSDGDLIKKIDCKNSGYEQFDVSYNSNSKETVSELMDLDAKMAAIFSHYVYFYLDYLELQTLHKRFFKKLRNDNSLLKGNLEYFINKLKTYKNIDSEYVPNFSINEINDDFQHEKVILNRWIGQKISDYIYNTKTNIINNINSISSDAANFTVTLLRDGVKFATFPITIALKAQKILSKVSKKEKASSRPAEGKDSNNTNCKKSSMNGFNTSMFAWGGANKVLFRIFSRLHEIYAIVQKDQSIKFATSEITFQVKSDNGDYLVAKEIEETLNSNSTLNHQIKKDVSEIELIYKAFKESETYPLDFYELYDLFKYWAYLKNNADNADELINEAKKWHIVHLGTSATAKQKTDNSNDNKDEFIKLKPLEITPSDLNNRNQYVCATEKIRYGWYHGLTGFGGGLFVKIENNYPTKFVYSTKGTDVNSFNDWVVVDLIQGLTGLSLQHFQTVKNAIQIDKLVRNLEKKINKDIPLYFCGHSLGGGLASSNALATGREAITFNAAGLNFIGGLWTRLVGTIGNGKWKETISPLAVANKVHPIRIDGEIVDVIMLISKPLTVNLNQRGYGRYSLVLKNIELNTGDKHGINNFLNNNIMNELRISHSGVGVRKITNATVKSSNYGVPTSQRTLSSINKDVKYKESHNKFVFDTKNNECQFLSAGMIYFHQLDLN